MGNRYQPYLETKILKKRFSHIEALQGASLTADREEILAIVGDNGAGKSTLMKVISGVLTPDGGEIIVEGRSFSRLTPRLAGECGISSVFQDLALVDTQSVWENIFLGHEYRRWGWLNKGRMRDEASRLLERLGIQIKDIDAPTGSLSGGQRQAVAVARALFHGGRMIIFDEPTAAMGIKETGLIQGLIKNLTKEGAGVVIISHNIQQVFSLADRICIMRLGKVLTTVDAAATTPDDIVSMIVSGVA